ncbi:unnamed protein product [Mytilus coruscus]|uniref:WSC domain-containing protein n=1 Tax=Mytilus coruscus TaxID=42192 RepID=A0A6J8DQE4_MYTCO|nr:unnamed protein product [Mytilus coruscus]
MQEDHNTLHMIQNLNNTKPSNTGGCSIFIGFPISNWTTSSQVCSLPEINNINTTDIFINLLDNTTFKEDDKAWTGTVIKYTKFAAFIGQHINLEVNQSMLTFEIRNLVKIFVYEEILQESAAKMNKVVGSDLIILKAQNVEQKTRHLNFKEMEKKKKSRRIQIKRIRNANRKGWRTKRCGRSYSPIDSGKNVKTVEDCLRHCSDYSFASYFVIKSSKCFCISDKPEINGDVNDCRTVCTNVRYTPCSSGRSALVFSFIEDINITITNTYIEQECVTTNKDQNRFTISDCNAKYLYGCRNISGKHSGTEFCVAVKKGKTNEFTVEECSRKFPFLCSRSIMMNKIADSPRIVTFPASVAAAEFVVIIILVFLVVLISVKSFKRIRFYKEQLKQVNERLPGTEFSTYTGIEETTEEVNNTGYKELSDNSQQNNEMGLEASEDGVDNQGYLIPEQHYHTIPEVEVHYAEANAAESYEDEVHYAEANAAESYEDEVHYAEANAAESYEDEEHIDKDGYLEPVTK